MGKLTRTEPFNWSDYNRTYNNAIDLVCQCIGHARKTMKPIKALRLKPSYYDLFKAGLNVLAKREIDPATELLFDGVKILRGSPMQFDSIVCEYYPVNLEAIN